jgi:hypothetical protein
MAGTVTITQGGSTAAGTDGCVLVFTGQAGSPVGATAAATNTTPSISVTPNATGSFVVASNLGLTGTYNAVSGTTIKSLHSGQSLEYVGTITTGTTTGGTPLTIGCTASVNSISIVAAEILAGSGTLALHASSPNGFTTTTLTATSNSFSPPPGSLIVLLVQLNGGSGSVTVTVTDTFGGLTWTPQGTTQNTAGNGMTAIYTAVMTPLVPPLNIPQAVRRAAYY